MPTQPIGADTSTGVLPAVVEQRVRALAQQLVDAVVGGVTPADRDTIRELGALLTADESALAALVTTVAGKFDKTGGTLTGPLTLAADPTTPLQAATRQYVLAQITALINGAPGALDTLNEIAVQLGNDESALAALVTTVAGKFDKTGGTLTGPLTLAADPTTPLQAATRQYVLAQIAALVNGAPGALDTLNEIAVQLGNDETAATALTGLVNGIRNLTDATFVANQSASIAAAVGLTRTAVKTANYTAAASELVPVDASAGSVTVTLPNAPADKARVQVKAIVAPGAGFTVSVACAGADTLNRSGGATSHAYSLIGQGATYQYDAATKVWTIAEFGIPLSQLDARFAAIGSGGGGSSFTSAITQVYQTSLTAQPATGQKVANLTSVANLAVGWTVVLGADLVTAERKIVQSIAGNDVTFTTNITGTHPTTELVIYANQPLDGDYLTAATYQQITGQKRFMSTLLSALTPGYASPGSSVGYALDLRAGISSRANGGGGIVVVPRAETKPVIDWISDGTNSGAYMFHVTQSLPAGTTNPGVNGASSATLFGIGIQGAGGAGILLAKDGPKGTGLFVDQKTVVTDPTAAGIAGLMSSYFAPFLSIPVNEPTTAPAISLSTGSHKTIPGERLLQWSASGITGTGAIDGQTGWLNNQFPIVADNSVNNTQSGLWFKGRGSSSWGNALMLDEIGPNPAGAAAAQEGAVRLLTSAGGSQHYTGSMRLSKTTQGLLIAVHASSHRIGAEAPEALADFAPSNGVRLGFGHDVAVTPLTIPTAVALSGAGATGGSTTYGYRVAAVNAKGTTLASTTVGTAVGAATLDGTNKIIITWAAALGASSYKVYGRTSGAELLMGTVTVPSRTVTDAVMQAAATRTVTDAVAVGAGSSQITSATAAFTPADVGAKIYLTSGSGLGPGYNGYETYGQITSYVDANTVNVSSVIGRAMTGVSLTISNPAMNRLTSATAAFTAADVGKGVMAPVGAAGAAVYGFITTYESTTSVLVSFTATTGITAGTVTITGGNVPLTFTDDGTVTPSGALPGVPVGTKLTVQKWASQSGPVLDVFDDLGTAAANRLFSLDRVGHLLVGTAASVTATIGAGTATVVASNAAGAQGAYDTAGGVTATAAATTPIAGVVANVTFGTAFTVTPKAIILTPTSAAAVAAGLYVSSKASSTFVVSAANAPAAGATLTFDYHVIG